jgi:hypothetical protein
LDAQATFPERKDLLTMPSIFRPRFPEAHRPLQPNQPDDLDGDEEMIFTLPADMAGELAESVGNQGPATSGHRPATGHLRLVGGHLEQNSARPAGNEGGETPATRPAPADSYDEVQLSGSGLNDSATFPPRRSFLGKLLSQASAPLDHFMRVCDAPEGQCGCLACEIGKKGRGNALRMRDA